jgi:hypothetical protein
MVAVVRLRRLTSGGLLVAGLFALIADGAHFHG